MADTPTSPAAAPSRAERLAALSAAVAQGRQSLEVLRPIAEALPAAFAFLGVVHQQLTHAHAAEQECGALRAARDELAQALEKTRHEHAAALATMGDEVKAARAARTQQIAALNAEVAGKRKTALADIATAHADADEAEQRRQAAVTAIARAEADATAAAQARLDALAAEEAATRQRIAVLHADLEALRAKLG